MKKFIIGIAVLIAGVTLFGTTASAHYLIVTGSSSCVREDGSWDWTANYTIPDEDWAEGLTVTVTWVPGQSGTSTSDFVYVTANGVWSNGNQGGGSTTIRKGEDCPPETTTTSTTSTTTTIAPTTTVGTTTTIASTTTGPDESTTTIPSTTTTVSPSPAPAIPKDSTTTSVPTVIITTVPEDLPATGVSNWRIVVIALGLIIVGSLALRWRKLGQ